MVLVDVQERLMPVIDGREELERRLAVLLEGTRALGLPLIWTEQYVKGLGATIPAIAELAAPLASPIEKLSFSCCPVPEVDAELKRLRPETVIVAGIETHVCVLQTCLDLLEGGYRPVLVSDCTSSRHAHDRERALRRLEQAGVTLTTVESVLFELLVRAGTEEFKAISRLVKPL
jgi:nicotinamidase-related amidase